MTWAAFVTYVEAQLQEVGASRDVQIDCIDFTDEASSVEVYGGDAPDGTIYPERLRIF